MAEEVEVVAEEVEVVAEEVEVVAEEVEEEVVAMVEEDSLRIQISSSKLRKEEAAKHQEPYPLSSLEIVPKQKSSWKQSEATSVSMLGLFQ